MLESRKTRVYNENKVVTILGPGTQMNGTLSCTGTIRIEGQMEGTVQSDDSVVLLDTGLVKGDILAGQVIVSGEVRGNIKAVDRLEITPRGKVRGDIVAPRICIHEGVFFEGRCSMKAAGTQPVPASSSTAPDNKTANTV